MFDPLRRKLIKVLPALAGGGIVLTNQAQAQPEKATESPHRKITPGGSRNLSRAVAFDRLLFVSGVLGVEEQSRKLASPEFDGQCRQAMQNLKASVEAGGSRLEQVLKCTCFLVEAADFEAFNKIYREFFPQDPPARSTVIVKDLVMAGARIEIDCFAHL